ncbi:hypothetical protein G3580_09835 [Nitrogeniibacter mangrovi]|uniref:NfeD-like C-terminal domain-containing protein n=1 Tax=Nitrogeniibacter mangrovi TaxID=2016596 RepID=A0A6C1B6P5_9RHOO|nr:NfeD family protein [Nitrogeniibacter mangrovi]QID17914.1 hypothetical protein G3580_09835 [Nitrogeniibacter mangrovi]
MPIDDGRRYGAGQGREAVTMCHILLLMPLLALPVFWLLPEGPAIGVYTVVLGLSAATYLLMVKVMHLPALFGVSTLIGRSGKVVACDERGLYVRVNSETWAARSDASTLTAGDPVRVVAVDGLTLCVEADIGSPPGRGACDASAGHDSRAP